MVEFSDTPIINRKDLEKKRVEYFQRSERAILNKTSQFCEITKILNHVNSNIVDIGEYVELASALASLLKEMGKGTIFYHYYYKNIDPTQYGRARYFRPICRDLFQQITELNKWRAAKRHIKVIK
ncbi:hypothetical protein QUF76_16820 [Desulfobacterales bacterium HSG16]|nr:hypothetical protein [Desulfobacterales bacterium HSG16]